ncbi:alcohol dehydrogenase catalytic domain-containing protein [Nocardia sp. NPDC059228]|uniref:alcohol dehydrogenase catalytic domain-containing protein n=1 Tax=Nocardia sp. NPDC059228 TaxID=3346777 RepID=UPI00369811BD
MRALIGGKGTEWVREDRELPEQLGAIRIQVMAAALNRADLYALDGSYATNSQGDGPFVAGLEVAGVVETSSLLAPHLPVGTRVMGITAGAFADYALCHPRLVLPIPDNLGFDAAATLPVGLTEHHPGTVIEISDVGGTKRLVFDLVRMAAANWDGSNPIQAIDAGLIGGDPAAMTAMFEALG